MKYIRIASDLHLEGFYGKDPAFLADSFLPADERDSESILVLAGDISSVAEQLLSFLQVCATRFPKIYYVPGNHEWYRHDYYTYTRELLKAYAERHLDGGPLRNVEMAFGDVCYEELEELKLRFIFGTLWGDGGPTLGDQGRVGFYMNDFRLITKGTFGNSPRRFTVQDMMELHQKHKKKIENYLEQPFDGRTVVITHHLPSRRLVSARFWPQDGTDGANGGFVGDCENAIAVHEPWLWIHGHTHDTIDTELWKTRVVCNPAGYRGEWHTPHNKFWSAKDGRPFAVPKFVELA